MMKLGSHFKGEDTGSYQAGQAGQPYIGESRREGAVTGVKIPEPANELERLKALRQYNILDTLPEKDFDDLVHLASHICGTPIALISLVDEQRQWFKSKVGLDATHTSRIIAFCARAILQPDLFIVPDALADERFRGNPLVTCDPKIRFYAGAPLITPEGYALGTLCVIDRVPRSLSREQKEALRALSRQVMAQLELRRLLTEFEKINRERADFIAMIIHDLRSPLTVVVSGAAMIRDGLFGPVSAEQKKWLTKIEAYCNRLVDLVNDCLDLSKLGTGRIKLAREEIDLKQLVESTLEEYQILAQDKKLSLRSSVDPSLKQVEADPRRLAQVLSNLLSNSIKFTPAGGTIEVGAIHDMMSTSEVKVWVKDTGVGIASHEMGSLFKIYQQTRSGERSKDRGTGLGLVSCKMIVEAHGGRIWAESQEGKGATFFFSLPRKK